MPRQTRLLWVCPGVICLFLLWLIARAPVMVAAGHAAGHDPDAACASCHRSIYARYEKTPMAHASGTAAEGFLPADFEHANSGVHYRITEEDGKVWLSYERDALTRGAVGALRGRQELRYFLGSGLRGRTYLFEQHGYWFEAPINWYAKKRVWDMAPNFQTTREMPLTLPVDPGCLHCHASGAASPLEDARNRYAGEPFAAGGITCEACHGDASAHVGSGGKTPMLRVDELEANRRDSVCLNCHLEGQVGVDRLGKRIENFKPGDELSDYTLFFTYKTENGSGGRATSQWEALLKSACKKKSGDKLTCTSCHDPHGSPAPEERVAFYRQRCLACHNGAGFAAGHHAENPDCTECHMARPPSNDIAHEQVTDHWIRKRVSQERLPLATSGELVTVGGGTASDRDLGLAYAQMAVRGDESAGMRAVEFLRRAEKSDPEAAKDSGLHAQLGFLEQVDGKTDEAAEEYRLALDADPQNALAAGDLALIEAKRHRAEEALRLWRTVDEHDPTQVAAAMNMAVVECALGEKDAALETLERTLEFSPDETAAKDFAEQIRSGKRSCGVR
ncbi:MAG TPA: cytochrome c3 family protein [Terracidiphilus sp.]|nr:cytochrome c3 family protein [Terracidiphilus sp.]